MPSPVRVVKFGGSLFDTADLPRLWRRWREQQTPATDVLVAGGGLFADAIRQADATHGLSDAVAHALAMASLGITARLLSTVLPEARLVERLADVGDHRVATPQPPIVLDVWECWRADTAGRALRALPASWKVTSDSLAAAVARELDAAELVLLKSADAGTTDLAALAAAGYVDGFFPQAAAGLQVRLVNLRKAAGTGSSGRGTARVP